MNRDITPPCAVMGGNEWEALSEVAPEKAKQICAGCPLVNECRLLADKLEFNDATGNWNQPRDIALVWGGETPSERAARRGKRKPGWTYPQVCPRGHDISEVRAKNPDNWNCPVCAYRRSAQPHHVAVRMGVLVA